MPNHIELEHPLRKAARDGLTNYMPVFNGCTLSEENGDPERSFYNATSILDDGCKTTWVEIVETGLVYIAFHTGYSLLATGFAIKDANDPRTRAFAEFLALAVGGEMENWIKCLVTEGEAHRGGIMLVPWLSGSSSEPQLKIVGEN